MPTTLNNMHHVFNITKIPLMKAGVSGVWPRIALHSGRVRWRRPRSGYWGGWKLGLEIGHVLKVDSVSLDETVLNCPPFKINIYYVKVNQSE